MSHYCCRTCDQCYEYCTCKSTNTKAENITPKENRDMFNFMLVKQRSIAEDIFKKYNTSYEDGIKAALKEAAFQGYIEGTRQAKETQ